MPVNSSTNTFNKIRGNVFHIRIGNNMADKFDIKDPAFLKLLEQEYATKYLQSLGVQTTQKNINRILKENPIENCQIMQSRLNGGLYTDTITIIPKSSGAHLNDGHKSQKQQVSGEMLTMLDLKRMSTVAGNGKGNKNGRLKQQQQQHIASQNQRGNFDSSNFRTKSTGTGLLMGSKKKESSSLSFNITSGKQPNNNNNSTAQTQQPGILSLSFSIQNMKKRYIFPFNETYKRKNNYKLSDDSHSGLGSLTQPQQPLLAYQSKQLHFPFTQCKLSLNTLRELQNPINVKLNEISEFLDCYYLQFPSEMFPEVVQLRPDSGGEGVEANNNVGGTMNSNSNPNPNFNININNVNKSNNIGSNTFIQQQQSINTMLQPPLLVSQQSHQQTRLTRQKRQKKKITPYNSNPNPKYHTLPKPNSIHFSKKQIQEMFQTIRSQSNCKMIGVFLHLAYWCVLGMVNPVQPQATVKKKMYIMMFQTLEYFQIRVESKRLWSILILPMLLLVLKMAAHYFLQKQYPRLFSSEEAKKVGADQLTLDKVMLLVTRLFDPGNLSGRFVFLESEITGQKGTFLKDKPFVRARMFGTSPSLQIVLPNPQNGKTRSIMAKNRGDDIGADGQGNGHHNRSKISEQQNSRSHKSQSKSSPFNSDPLKDKKECQQKLLCLALHKINNRLEEINQGSNYANPIIRLKD